MGDYNNPRHNYRVSGKTLSGAGEGGKKSTPQCYKRGGKVMRDNDHDADDGYKHGGSVKASRGESKVSKVPPTHHKSTGSTGKGRMKNY